MEGIHMNGIGRIVRYKNRVILMFALLTAALVTCIALWQGEAAAQADMQGQLAEEIIRFHVIANSDSEEDQSLKLKVRDEIADYLKKEMPEYINIEETAMWLREHTGEMEAAGRKALKRAGADQPVNAAVISCWFEDRTYGSMYFPAGNYETLRVEIGAAEGHNWWCVLYPGMCFRDAVNVVYPDGSSDKIGNVLTEKEYSGVTATSDFKIGWYFWKGK